MFSVRCPRHRRWVLLDTSAIRALDAAPDSGFSIHYRCSCGHEGVWPEAPGEERMAG